MPLRPWVLGDNWLGFARLVAQNMIPTCFGDKRAAISCGCPPKLFQKNGKHFPLLATNNLKIIWPKKGFKKNRQHFPLSSSNMWGPLDRSNLGQILAALHTHTRECLFCSKNFRGLSILNLLDGEQGETLSIFSRAFGGHSIFNVLQKNFWWMTWWNAVFFSWPYFRVIGFSVTFAFPNREIIHCVLLISVFFLLIFGGVDNKGKCRPIPGRALG